MNDVDLVARSARVAAEPEHLAAGWLAEFGRALARRDAQAVAALFQPDSHWRDLVAFTWTITSTLGAAKLAPLLVSRQAEVGARNFRLAEGRTAPRRVRRLGTEVVEAIFEYETALGRGNAKLALSL